MKITKTTGTESWAAVHSPWQVYIALPSPISPMTGRCGSASFTPMAAGSPQPMPPPRRPKKLLASSHLKKVRTPAPEEIVSSTMVAPAGVAWATACTRASGAIGARLAAFRAFCSSSARSAALAATAASRRLAACGGPVLLLWRRTASHSSGSVALGSPWMPTAAA